MLDDPDAPLPELMEEAIIRYREVLVRCDLMVSRGKINGVQRREILLRVAERLKIGEIPTTGQGPNHTFKEGQSQRSKRLALYRSKWEKELSI